MLYPHYKEKFCVLLLLLFKLDILHLAELMGAGQLLKAVRLAGLGSAFFVTPKSYTRIDLLLFPFAMRESCDKIGVLFGAFALGGETAKRGSKER